MLNQIRVLQSSLSPFVLARNSYRNQFPQHFQRDAKVESSPQFSETELQKQITIVIKLELANYLTQQITTKTATFNFQRCYFRL